MESAYPAAFHPSYPWRTTDSCRTLEGEKGNKMKMEEEEEEGSSCRQDSTSLRDLQGPQTQTLDQQVGSLNPCQNPYHICLSINGLFFFFFFNSLLVFGL